MKKYIFLLLLSVLCLTCKNPLSHSDHGGSITRIRFLGWLSENISPSLSQNQPAGQTAYYNFWIYYEGDFDYTDLDYAYVYATDDCRWTINVGPSYFNKQQKFIGGRGRWYDDRNPNVLPIGPFRVEVRLRNGNSATYAVNIPAPGSTTTNGCSTMYSQDVISPPADSAPMVMRATVTPGASIDTLNQTVSIPFSVNDAKVYNGRVFFRDASYNDVGFAPLFINPQTGVANSQYLGTATFYTNGTVNTATYGVSDIQFEAGRSFTDIANYYIALTDGAQYGLGGDDSYPCDCLSFSDNGSLSSGSQTLTANAGSDANAVIGQTVTLSGSTNAIGSPTYSWVMTTKPPGSSSTLSGSSSANPDFIPDKPGAYHCTLVVTANSATSPYDEVVVYAYKRRYSGLPGSIAAVEYDKVHNRLVIASSDPNRLVLFDPLDGTSQYAALNYPPTCVTVTTDGNQAAVGHDRHLSIVDVSTAAPGVAVDYPINDNGNTYGNLKNVVFDKRGYVYCFPKNEQWISLRQVKASDGTQRFILMNMLYAGSYARIHPSNNSIYYSDAALSPPCLHWVSIANPDFTAGNDFCDTAQGSIGFWFSEMGSMLVACTGLVYSITESGSSETDMTDLGSLYSAMGNIGIKWLDHSANASTGYVTSLFAAIARTDWGANSNSGSDTRVNLIDAASFGLVDSVDLPLFIQNSVATRAHGYYIFWNSSGGELYVVVKSDGAANQLMYDLVVF